MAKHGFKVSERNSKLVVADSVGEVGTLPTVTADSDAWASHVIDGALASLHVADVATVTDEGMIIDVVGDEVVVVPQGWDVIEGGLEVADTGQGGSVILSGDGEVVATLACEPDVIRTLPALVADDDGMGQMQATDVMLPVMTETAGVNVAPLHEALAALKASVAAGMTDAALDVVASEPTPSPFAALVADFKPVMVADSVVSLALPAMVAGEARLMAQRIADLTGATVTVTGPDGDEAIAPRSRGAKVARVHAASVGERSTVVKLTPGLSVAGDWLTYDARLVCTHPGNASNIKTWEKIRDAGAKLDLDSLLAFDFAGARDEMSGNTYTKNNGRYLRAMIAKVEAAQAALDAEFGIKLAAD